MREIVFDTETTGFDPDSGDRIVEIGAIELINHLPSGAKFHKYINPERSMPADAFAVHGLGDDFLADKPKFAEIAQDWADFIGDDGILIAHNASFDMKFINFELTRAGQSAVPWNRVCDSLALARKKFPGAQNSLDALCRRFGVDNAGRTLHGALLDSELLAEVYLELIGGRQPGLVLDQPATGDADDASATQNAASGPRARRAAPLPPRLTAEEAAAHEAFVADLGEDALWRQFVRPDPA